MIQLSPVQTLALTIGVKAVRRQLVHLCETVYFQAKLGGKIAPPVIKKKDNVYMIFLEMFTLFTDDYVYAFP